MQAPFAQPRPAFKERPLFLKNRICQVNSANQQYPTVDCARHLCAAENSPAYPADFAALRARAVALARSRSIWPLGRVTQISPIHSSFTPWIGLALKLARLTSEGDFPRSMVFR